jgi:hypothetical protein
MREILPIVALAALVACGQAKSNDEAAQTPAAPHSNAQAGTFMRTNADGSLLTEILKDDGSYTYWAGGAMTESGKWAVKDNKTCFTPEDGTERCATDGAVGSDGTFTETPDGAPAYKVEKTA